MLPELLDGLRQIKTNEGFLLEAARRHRAKCPAMNRRGHMLSMFSLRLHFPISLCPLSLSRPESSTTAIDSPPLLRFRLVLASIRN